MPGDFEAVLHGLDERVHESVPIAVGAGAEYIRGVAAPLTPFLEGWLVNSAGVTVVGDEGRVTYAGPYARYQHYGLDFHHTQGQALYLEQPMIQNADEAVQVMADTLGKAF